MKHHVKAWGASLALALMAGATLAQNPQPLPLDKAFPDALATIAVPDLPAAQAAYEAGSMGALFRDEEVAAFIGSLTRGMDGPFMDMVRQAERDSGLPIEDLLKLLVQDFGVALLDVDGAAIETQGKRDRATIDLFSISAALDTFEIDLGRKPTSLQELLSSTDKSWRGPYLWGADPLKDPWGNDYVLDKDGLRCLGSDGKPGGEGTAADFDGGGRIQAATSPVKAIASLRVQEGSGPLIVKTLEKLFEKMPPEARPALDPKFGVAGWDLDGPQGRVQIFYKGGHFVATLGDGVLQRGVDFINGKAAAPAKSAFAESFNLATSYVRGTVQVKRLIKRLPPLPPQGEAGLSASGLGSIEALGFDFGIHNGRSVLRLGLDAPGERTGVLKALMAAAPTPDPLTFADRIPSYATTYAAQNFDLGALWDAVLATVKAVEPRAAEEADQALGEADKGLGFSLRKDLLGAFGSSVFAYGYTPHGGGLLAQGVMFFELKDKARFERVLAGLQRGGALEPKTLVYRGKAIQYLSAPLGRLGENPFQREPRDLGEAVGFLGLLFSGFAYIEEGGWLIASNHVQALKDHIDWQGQNSRTSLSKAEAFSKLYAEAGSSPLGFVTYEDGAASFAAGYNTLLPIVQLFEGAARKFGVPLDLALAPRGATLAPYMKPALSYSRQVGTLAYVQLELQAGGMGSAALAASGAGIVAAIAVPNLLRARSAANEAAAISSLRTLVSAQAMFYQGDMEGDDTNDYAQSLWELGSAELIDGVLSSGVRNGYRFELRSGDGGETWECFASPVQPGSTGHRWFYVSESGVIRYEYGMPAGPESPPLQ